jgi:hypothetical protein
MQTCSFAATGRPEWWSSALARLAYAAFLLCSTIAPSLAGFQGSGMGRFAVQHDNRAARSLYYNGPRAGAIPNPVYQRPLGGTNREARESQNTVFPDPVSKIGETGRNESALSMRNPNPPSSIPSFVAAPQEPKGKAEINPPTERSKSLDLTAASETRAKINDKFERYKNKIAVESGMAEQRRDRLDRSRGFLVNLIDLGYAPSLVDSWCDDLLDDEVVDGMPMDLVDLYWGPPVATQDFVEYYNPYELCTYRTAQGDYRQVTYSNRIVSEPKANAANFRNR